MDNIEAALERARALIFTDSVETVAALEALYHALALLANSKQAETEPASEGRATPTL